MKSDLDLLQLYAHEDSEEAFATLVERHLDLVYSAAVRQVRSPQLAEEIAQSVFTDLARNIRRLQAGTVLTAWLYQVTRRTAIDVIRRESRRQSRERMAVELSDMKSDSSDWTQLEPLLDEAMDELGEADRAAILLRYFENKSLREVGQTLGSSEGAAQKRISRAVERLREFLLKRGVSVGSAGLVAAVTANAVQAAPIGLCTSISTGVALSAAALHQAGTLGLTKALTMTTLQKTLIAVTITAAVGTGIYEARRASQLQQQVQALQQQQGPLTSQLEQLRRQHEDGTSRLAALQQQNEQLRGDLAELPKLRGEIARLRNATHERQGNDPFVQSVLALAARAAELNQRLEQMPDKKIPELQWLAENDWLEAAKDVDFSSDIKVRQALSQLRRLAKEKVYPAWQDALNAYIRAHDERLPTDPAQLKPYFKMPVDDLILQRYKMLRTGKAADFRPQDWLIAEKAPVDHEYDTRFKMGLGTSTTIAIGLGEVGDVEDKD